MTSFYKNAWKLGQLPAFLICLFLFNTQQSWGQIAPVPMADGTYTENFDAIGTSTTTGWMANFGAGTGANRFGVAPPQTSPNLPNQTTVFSTGSGGGVQKGTGAIVLLATGASPDGGSAAAFDLYLNFNGTTAGSITLDWAEVNNGTVESNRRSTFKLQTNTGEGGAFVDLPHPSVVITNNVPSAGSLTSIPLPSSFANNPSAKIRFFLVTSAGGTTGSRPKISIDNLVVTTGTGTPPTPAANITTTASAFNSPYCITATAGSTPFNVAYTSSGTFTGGFKVQLSNASGEFPTNVTDNIIGNGTSSPISAAIPKATPSGTKYRLRVVNDAPATYGSNNGSDLAVNLTSDSNPVTVTPSNAQTVIATGMGDALTASAAATSTFKWLYSTSAAGSYTAIGGATTATYTVRGADFPGVGTYYLSAQATLTTDCGTTTGQSSPITATSALATTGSAPAAGLTNSLVVLPASS